MLKELCECCKGEGFLSDESGNISSCMNCNGTGFHKFPELLCNCNATEQFKDMFQRFLNSVIRTWNYTEEKCPKCGMWKWYLTASYCLKDDYFEDEND